MRKRFVPQSGPPCCRLGCRANVYASHWALSREWSYTAPANRRDLSIRFHMISHWGNFQLSLKMLIALSLNYTILSFFLKRFLWVVRIKAPLSIIYTPNLDIICPIFVPLCGVLFCGHSGEHRERKASGWAPRSSCTCRHHCVLSTCLQPILSKSIKSNHSEHKVE